MREKEPENDVEVAVPAPQTSMPGKSGRNRRSPPPKKVPIWTQNSAERTLISTGVEKRDGDYAIRQCSNGFGGSGRREEGQNDVIVPHHQPPPSTTTRHPPHPPTAPPTKPPPHHTPHTHHTNHHHPPPPPTTPPITKIMSKPLYTPSHPCRPRSGSTRTYTARGGHCGREGDPFNSKFELA